MIFELEWHIGLSVFPSKPAHHILSQSQYAGARPSLLRTLYTIIAQGAENVKKQKMQQLPFFGPQNLTSCNFAAP